MFDVNRCFAHRNMELNKIYNGFRFGFGLGFRFGKGERTWQLKMLNAATSTLSMRILVGSQMPEEDTLYDLAELFKVFGDSTRIRILFALFEQDICVCDLAETLGMTQSAVSHQLKILKQAHLVSARRDGKQVIYYLADDHVRIIIEKGLEHIEE